MSEEQCGEIDKKLDAILEHLKNRKPEVDDQLKKMLMCACGVDKSEGEEKGCGCGCDCECCKSGKCKCCKVS